MKLRESINDVLAEWNPIDVPRNIALIEYESYISDILSTARNLDALIKHLEQIVSVEMGLNYNPKNANHKGELVAVAERIYLAAS